MNDHQFTLQPYRGPASRFRCPQCKHHSKTFTRYIDNETGKYIHDDVGRCDREEKCGYHYPPAAYFSDMATIFPTRRRVPTLNLLPPQKQFDTLPAQLVNGSMQQKQYINNNFIVFLAKYYQWERALQAAERYRIGTARHWPGACVYWQVDRWNRVRTGKIMLYNAETGKRVKEPFNHIAWAHKLFGSKQLPVGSNSFGSGQIAAGGQNTATYLLKQCFFGEHLLNDNKDAIVGITESEKTAVMASMMMPDLIWLAAGSLHGLDDDKCQALKNRTVLLFPDVGAYGLWVERARTLNLKMPGTTFAVHDEMEKTATDEERTNGADMADRWIAERRSTRSP